MPTPTTVAVLGLGAMGLPMASHLATDFAVRGFDPDAERRRQAAEAGVDAVASAEEAAQDADVLLLAVRDAVQLEAALYGDPDDDGATGAAGLLAPGAAVVLTSTVGVTAVRDLEPRLRGDGLHLVDAPVSGGPARAGTGDLLVTVGADDAAYAAAEPALEAMAGTLVRIGPAAGDGQAMKTVNQLLCGVHIAAAAEALALADALGLDPAKALETLGAGAAASFMLGDRGPRILQAYDDEPAEVRSRLDIFVKDLGIVGDAARARGLATPIASAAESLFLLGQAHGDGARDDSSVIRVVAPSRRSAR